MAASDQLNVTLDRSVALVLFDFLSRTADEEEGEPHRMGQPAYAEKGH